MLSKNSITLPKTPSALCRVFVPAREPGEGVAIVPACVQQLRSDGVSFHPLLDRGCHMDVVLAWRRDEPNAIRDGFLDLLRNKQAEIERVNAATEVSHFRRRTR